MPRLLATLMRMRRDPRLLKLPPYISLLCVVVGVVWFFMLPLQEYSRRTYISENALLPGQVHTYFGGSDHNVLRAYRHEIDELREKNNFEVNDALEQMLKGIGLKVGRQNYTYHSLGDTYTGENIYAILQAPRGDATEAIVLVAAWKSIADQFNRNGLAVSLALARYFKRWSLWSKDIILVIPPDSFTGTQAWVDAYHDAHDPSRVSPLPLKSGALQGALAIDFPDEQRFEAIHIVYDGVNGQLPNLDLINSVVSIANGQMGMGSVLQGRQRHRDHYQNRLSVMLRGMLNQALGHAVGPHSSFIPYHVDAITLQPIGKGWHDEMSMGRLIEGAFRSLNNLLEKLHQSFFFYLLMHKERFVSIGTYLPSAMLVAANFTIQAIYLWVKSGYTEAETTPAEGIKPVAERALFLPLGLVAASHFLGVVPLFIFNHTPSFLLTPVFVVFTVLNSVLPFGFSFFLQSRQVSSQQFQLTKSFSLLLLGMFLSALATLNFSLAFLVGLLSVPLSFARTWHVANPTTSPTALQLGGKWAYFTVLQLLSPPIVVLIGTGVLTAVKMMADAAVPEDASAEGPNAVLLLVETLREVLTRAAFGWDIWGMYTPIVVWCLWWPAWIVGSVVTLGRPSLPSVSSSATEKEKKEK